MLLSSEVPRFYTITKKSFIYFYMKTEMNFSRRTKGQGYLEKEDIRKIYSIFYIYLKEQNLSENK